MCAIDFNILSSLPKLTFSIFLYIFWAGKSPLSRTFRSLFIIMVRILPPILPCLHHKEGQNQCHYKDQEQKAPSCQLVFELNNQDNSHAYKDYKVNYLRYPVPGAACQKKILIVYFRVNIIIHI